MKKQAKLKSLINRKSLTASLIPLFTIEVILLFMYFGATHFIAAANERTLLQEVELSLHEITSCEAGHINEQLREVSRLSRILQRDHQDFFARQEHPCSLNETPRFGVHENGAYYKLEDNGGASLYYSSSTPIGPEEDRKALDSEVLDPLLKSIVETSPIVTQAYLNTWDDMNRSYPFIPDAPAQYGPAMEMDEYNFYYLADIKHNPRRGPVWTGVYLDPSGKGWMVSNIVPIYRGDFLEGVSGLDVTVDTIIREVLHLELPWKSSSLVLDEMGTILAMQQGVGEILGLGKASLHGFENNFGKPEGYSIFDGGNPEFNAHMQKVILHREEVSEVELNDIGYLVSQQVVPETGWRLVTFIEKRSLVASSRQLKERTIQAGYAALGIMVVFYVLFCLYILNRSHRLATLIARPIERLTDLTGRLEEGKQEKMERVGITEIDDLSRNFQAMTERLDDRTAELVEARIVQRLKEREAELYEQMAETDQLTDLPNRRKLDRILEDELARSRRYGKPFGVIIMDIDHFKTVNDVYGHQVGDMVLVEMAARLNESIRSTDVAGRWGGEEFLVICPEADPVGITVMAENLRRYIDEHDFPVVVKKTASFGISILRKDEAVHDLVARADEALYLAKSSGRNCVKFK